MLAADARNGQNAVEGIGLFGPGIGGGVQYVIGGHGLSGGMCALIIRIFMALTSLFMLIWSDLSVF